MQKSHVKQRTMQRTNDRAKNESRKKTREIEMRTKSSSGRIFFNVTKQQHEEVTAISKAMAANCKEEKKDEECIAL